MIGDGGSVAIVRLRGITAMRHLLLRATISLTMAGARSLIALASKLSLALVPMPPADRF